jgi:pyruvate dehydrogenase E1 component
MAPEAVQMTASTLEILKELERKVLWLSAWTIHNANHLRENRDGLKVGGHQASCASAATIMTALYFAALKPEDRVAVKPHAGPVFHAIQYLLGRQKREKLEKFRAYGGAQSYPSRTKDADGVDFSTGSVGLGVAQTLFSSLVQDYIRAKDWGAGSPEGRMIAILGDAELDEGNISEAMLEGWKHGLRNTWWIVDYNRQSLDAVIHEGLWAKIEAMFRNFGWDVVVLRHGKLQEAAFAEPGGEALRRWIEACPNELYSALGFQGGVAWRKRLLQEIGGEADVPALIGRRSDEELAALMGNLGGHDLETLLEAFGEAARHDRPVCFIAYTIKGFGLPIAGHKDNHAGLMTPAQIEGLRASMNIRQGREWDAFEGLRVPASDLVQFLQGTKAAQKPLHPAEAPRIETPARLDYPKQPSMSTQQAFGLLMHEIAKREDAFAARVATVSPDVTVSTNLGAWVNRRNVYGREQIQDLFRAEHIPSAYNWSMSPTGQHFELGIAEMNLFAMLSAMGLSHAISGERLLPVGTLYDPFIERGLDALNYACYQDARFILVATPSGVTLAPEGGAHQSIATPLIGMAQDRLTFFEPAFADELAVILRWGFDHIQAPAGAEDGGSVYLRLSTRSLDQPQREMKAELESAILNGAYWLRRPGPNAEAAIAFSGALAPEAIDATGLAGEDRRDIGLLCVTSADRLYADWMRSQRAREQGLEPARSHIEEIMAGLPSHCGLVTVLDGHPATLGWLGSVCGHRTRPLGVHHFGQSGALPDLYRHYGIDARAIAEAVQAIAPGRPLRHIWAASAAAL